MNYQNPPVFIPGNTIAMADSYVVNSESNTVAALFEMDLTDVKPLLQKKREKGENVAVTAWILKLVSSALEDHNFQKSDKKLNYAMWLEKEFENHIYSVPVQVDDASSKSIEDISKEIGYAKGTLSKERKFLKYNNSHKAFKYMLYLPKAFKKWLWRFFIKNPKLAFQKMGNGAFSYISTTGNYSKEYQTSAEEISLGISSMYHKPRLIDYGIKMRDIVPVTVLVNKELLKNQDTSGFVKDITHHINNNAAFI